LTGKSHACLCLQVRTHTGRFFVVQCSFLHGGWPLWSAVPPPPPKKEDGEDLTPAETYLRRNERPPTDAEEPPGCSAGARTHLFYGHFCAGPEAGLRAYVNHRHHHHYHQKNSVNKVSARSSLISIEVPFSHEEQPTFHIGFWQHIYICSSSSHGSIPPFLVG
jgi:hypothetical protein